MPLEKFEDFFKAPEQLPDLSAEEASALHGMLSQFLKSSEWEWFRRQIELCLRSEFNHLQSDSGDELLRAQGAFRALYNILRTPEYTHQVLSAHLFGPSKEE